MSALYLRLNLLHQRSHHTANYRSQLVFTFFLAGQSGVAISLSEVDTATQQLFVIKRGVDQSLWQSQSISVAQKTTN